ncbi:DUF3157 family protein [uncultured Algibacter sp.]|uniref:DUF3157 family protein n=1 Tax=uncultured Algibacter sp. TaxID=298659 RepID=UPI0026077F33|nr:DUF3157 family protein [uncultured Algibacter sp.]
MKTYFFIFLFFISCIGFAQNNYIVKTEDGRRVLLKADYTWEYIDLEVPAEKSTDSTIVAGTLPTISKTCNLAPDFVEPKLNSKIQSQLKKGRATMKHVKKKVAKDYNCTEAEVILISYKEQKESGAYIFCANGVKVAYKRMGTSIMKKGKLF